MAEPIKVLLMDDRAATIESARNALKEGFSFQYLTSSEHLIATMREWRPNVLMLDFYFPNIREILETLVAAELNRTQLTLALGPANPTGIIEDEAVTLYEERFRGYWVPSLFNPKELPLMLDRWLPQWEQETRSDHQSGTPEA